MEHVAARPVPAAVAASLAAAALGLLLVAGLTGRGLLIAALLLATAPLVWVRTVPWRVLVGVLILIIVFIPIRRFYFATGLPIQLEPYRVVVALLLGAWLAALLVDERLRLRKTGFEGPALIVALAALGSVLANATRVAPVQTEVLKSLSFLASYLLIFFLVATVTRTARDTNSILKTLVVGMSVLGALAVIESRTGMSPFGRISEMLPLLQDSEDELMRGAGTRARASAEHPIALGAALVLAVPVAFYLASTAKAKRAWWWIALATLSLGALATLSRTGVLMLVAVAAVYLWLRPRQTVRLWPLLLPFLAVVHFAAPGTLGTLKQSFLPEGGLIAEQARDVHGDCDASGRVADLGPTLKEVAGQPLLGIGYGTRIVGVEDANACILDNQWLGTLLETGIIGLLAWVWFFARFIRRLGRAAARRAPESDLCVALAAAVTSYAVGMFVFDAMGFVQVTFLLFLLMALGASTVARVDSASEDARSAAQVFVPERKRAVTLPGDTG
jgi:polysaccharide biosynthesis protein PslJ